MPNTVPWRSTPSQQNIPPVGLKHILAFESDFKKRRFSTFCINTNSTVMNGEINDLFPSVYTFAFGVKQRRTIVNDGLSYQSVSRGLFAI